jgi:hypothetical protein
MHRTQGESMQHRLDQMQPHEKVRFLSREFLGDIRKMHTLATLEELRPDGYRIKPYGRDVYKRYPF